MSTSPDTTPGPGHEWHRVHPLTPLVRSWLVIVVIAAAVIRNWGEQGFDTELPRGPWALVVLGAAVLALLVLVGAMALSWRVTRYRVDSEVVHLERGVVVRQRRQARLDRLQSVDVEQPLLARLLGLAQLTLRVAGGGNAVAIQYLGLEHAERLRAEVLAHAAGLTVPEGGSRGAGEPDAQAVPEAPERRLVQVPTGRLLGSVALGTAPVTVIVLVALGVVVIASRGAAAGVLGALVPAAIGVGSAMWNRFNASFDFTAAASPDGLRLRRGFTAKRALTVPPGRVQGVELRQPLLWRGLGWWQVRVDVAGRAERREAGEDAMGGVVTVLPVGRVPDALALLDFLVPDPGADDAAGLLAAAMTGRDGRAGFTTSPARARWVDPLAWRRNGFRATGTVLVLRAGRLTRRTFLVPHAKPQSLVLTQGPVQRRLRVASVAVHLPGSGIAPVAPHLDAGAGASLLADEAARGRAARRAAGPERWLEGRGGSQS